MNPVLKTLSPTAANMIRADHTHVLATFHKYHPDTPAATKRALVNTACLALEVHAQLEEELFYPAMRGIEGTQNEVLDKSVPEHDEMRRQIAKLRAMEPTDAEYDTTFNALMRDVIHHVADEESVLLADAERLMPQRQAELGAEMTKRRMALIAPKAGAIASNMVQAMPATSLFTAAAAFMVGAYVLERAFGSRR